MENLIDTTKPVVVISDIAGRYDELLKLVEMCPTDSHFVACGDLTDRGVQSKEVVQWFMDNQHRATAIKGNHCHMMADACQPSGASLYQSGIWAWNGGDATLRSYGGTVPQDHLDFLASRGRALQLTIDGKLFLITHAPITQEWLDGENVYDIDFLWNRYDPPQTDRFFLQVYGHNSSRGVRWHTNDQGEHYAVCIDTSGGRSLTGLHLNTLTIYQQEYLPANAG